MDEYKFHIQKIFNDTVLDLHQNLAKIVFFSIQAIEEALWAEEKKRMFLKIGSVKYFCIEEPVATPSWTNQMGWNIHFCQHTEERFLLASTVLSII